MVTANELWSSASELLRSEVADGVWQSTFAQVAPIDLNSDSFTLAVPNPIIRDRLDGRYRPLVEDAVSEAAGVELKILFQLVVPTLFDQADNTQIDLTDQNPAQTGTPALNQPIPNAVGGRPLGDHGLGDPSLGDNGLGGPVRLVRRNSDRRPMTRRRWPTLA